MTNRFSKVEVVSPPRITMAIGLWISFPGWFPLNANGISARAEARAVINMGFSRSCDPFIMVSFSPMPCLCRNWYLDTSRMPL